MNFKNPLYSLLFSTSLLLTVSCSKQEKTAEGVIKINKNGIPVMQPLQEPLPKLSPSFINDKKYGVSMFFEKTWSEKNDNVSFLVAKNGQIIYENYMGYANKQKDEKITKDTPLHIASVSKMLTATAVLMLIDAKKIKLEQKVNTIIDSFPYPDVTIQTLLNHRSGMKNYAYFTYENNNWDTKKLLTNQDIIKVMVEKEIPLETKTDTHFSYCNTNYAVLALIIEKITGLSYPEAMKEMIFTPLGMTHTYVCDFEKDKHHIVPSYKGNNVEIGTDYLDGIYGDKNIYSTPRDLLKFDVARYAPFFLNPELLKKVYQGYSYEAKGLRNYGLGVRIIEFEKGEPFFYHNGWWHGNTSSMITLRKEKVTIITLSNKYTKKTYQTKKIASLFGDYPFKMNESGEE
ncbi:serine hydrolase domain-containing protein [Flavobacterium sedimenticola]|uniref:Serine hydrolase domain-containing protein n=1 Tax=Flavobacterium sedimenticola TaxID=3043286 RepID=A0ABT6XTX9_9FLAO|nr:serine hydrolase domain-containing protein [Flavobacterium sedimenticola]MDI9258435.1 serine hydrolase domain-containing protein [Flavobacterium sedimenticola]